ncbi:CoA transferase [Pseudomonas yamanorum]|nr:CoA transferase [Pseudomonas yamanorum]
MLNDPDVDHQQRDKPDGVGQQCGTAWNEQGTKGTFGRGYGQHLDVSIHDSILSWTAPTAWLARSFEKNPVMSPLVMPENDIFETQDGRHLALGILENKFWINLCDCLGEASPLLKDPRFSTRMGRLACKLEVNQLLKQIFLSKPLAQWTQYFADVDLPFSPLLGANELFGDAHVQSRGTLREFAKEGTIAVRFPVKFSLGLPDAEGKVPALGEFTPDATE